MIQKIVGGRRGFYRNQQSTDGAWLMKKIKEMEIDTIISTVKSEVDRKFGEHNSKGLVKKKLVGVTEKNIYKL